MVVGIKLLFALLLLMGFYKLIDTLTIFKASPYSSKSLKFAFTLKVIAGGLLFLIYTHYYSDRSTADIFKYYDDGEILYTSTKAHPLDLVKIIVGVENQYLREQYLNKMSYWYRPYDHGLRNDNRIVIRINALLHVISFGNYFIHALIFIFLSFLGLFYLAKLFYAVSGSKIKSYFAAFLIPSVFFWTSGVLKEALLIFALGLFCWSMFKLATSFSWSALIVVTLGFLLLFSIKIYVLVAILPAILFWFLWMRFKVFWKASFLFLILGFLCYVSVVVLFPTIDLVSLLVAKQHDFIRLSLEFNAGSAIQMDYLEENFGSILRSIPLALVHVFTLPWLSHVKSWLYIGPLLENLFLLASCLASIYFFQKPSKSGVQFLVFAGIFIFTLFTIIGLSTPVIGALVRYKIPALPFLFFCFFYGINLRSMPLRISQDKRIVWIQKHL